ncbi:hypothetical protein ANSO36C_63310 (plasmid) [Nostoc cf. commune SO-36]|uniref:Uncharacterized protein n=1 Tax=Nostoc cf. commune SO-36 TaxID=449208 RepID=A0ABM7ZB84_NOSCO|nr:hypothetical protein ANSO36C_63310 [Nostoc cf. commune SO-36]
MKCPAVAYKTGGESTASSSLSPKLRLLIESNNRKPGEIVKLNISKLQSSGAKKRFPSGAVIAYIAVGRH